MARLAAGVAAGYAHEPPMRSELMPPQLFMSNLLLGTGWVLQLGKPSWHLRPAAVAAAVVQAATYRRSSSHLEEL